MKPTSLIPDYGCGEQCVAPGALPGERCPAQQATTRHRVFRAGRQAGAIMPLLVAGMVAMLAMAGLALDLGHAYVNRTQLQNALDAAALSAAKQLAVVGENTSSTARTAATNAATTAFSSVLLNNPDKTRTVSAPSVTFSNAEGGPFSASGSPANFVRVSATGSLPTWLVRIVGSNNLALGASAVAGTLTKNQACANTPLVICSESTNTTPGIPNDYDPGDFKSYTDSNGPTLAEEMANPALTCRNISEPYTLEKGNKIGSIAEGLNTRFNEYKGQANKLDPSGYPPDKNITIKHSVGTDTGNYTYIEYKAAIVSGNYPAPIPANGKDYRRILRITLANCKTEKVEGIACLFMRAPANSSVKINGKNNNTKIYGEFTPAADCPNYASSSGAGGGGSGGSRIILFKDPTAGSVQ